MKAVPIVCISLKKASDRRAFMQAQFDKRELSVTFFDGIVVREAADAISTRCVEARLRRYGRPLSNGEVGCYLSHREVWKQLIESDDDAVCVMEDDIEIFDDFKGALSEVASHAAHWQIVRFMGLNRNVRLPHTVLPNGTTLMWMDRQPVGTQCYVVNRSGAEALLKHTEVMVHAIDTAIDRHWEHKLKIFVTEPEYVKASDMDSMIHPWQGVATFGMRMKEKVFRRLDKYRASKYNAVHRPKGVVSARSGEDVL